jgi:hypothetical protein
MSVVPLSAMPAAGVAAGATKGEGGNEASSFASAR